jgi:cation transport ATPase
MAMTVLTPRDSAERIELPIPAVAASRWRRAVIRGVRQNLAPWLAVKALLTVLVFSGRMAVWTAFVLDTAVSLVVLAYGWWLARR